MNKFSSEYLKLADNLLKQFALTQSDDLSAILTKENIEAFQSQYVGTRVRCFPPIKTVGLFMQQVASESKSCRHALIEHCRDQIAIGHEPTKTENSGYCKARQRLIEITIEQLVTHSGTNLDDASPESWRWHDRRVLIPDGSTLSMPDTPENQRAYPQPHSQKKGLEIPS